jgi:hypothetical protein
MYVARRNRPTYQRTLSGRAYDAHRQHDPRQRFWPIPTRSRQRAAARSDRRSPCKPRFARMPRANAGAKNRAVRVSDPGALGGRSGRKCGLEHCRPILHSDLSNGRQRMEQRPTYPLRSGPRVSVGTIVRRRPARRSSARRSAIPASASARYLSRRAARTMRAALHGRPAELLPHVRRAGPSWGGTAAYADTHPLHSWAWATPLPAGFGPSRTAGPLFCGRLSPCSGR